MSHESAAATAERMNARDAGVLRYVAVNIGRESVIVVYDMAGRELGLL